MIAGGETRIEPELIARAREEARVLASSISASSDTPENVIVARSAAKLRKSKPQPPSPLLAIEGPGIIKATISPASIDRLELALTRLETSLGAVGARFDKGEKAAIIAYDGERIGFSVTEALRREKHVLTEQEKAHDEARRRRRSKPSNSWDDELAFATSFLRRPN